MFTKSFGVLAFWLRQLLSLQNHYASSHCEASRMPSLKPYFYSTTFYFSIWQWASEPIAKHLPNACHNVNPFWLVAPFCSLVPDQWLFAQPLGSKLCCQSLQGKGRNMCVLRLREQYSVKSLCMTCALNMSHLSVTPALTLSKMESPWGKSGTHTNMNPIHEYLSHSFISQIGGGVHAEDMRMFARRVIETHCQEEL